MNIKCVTVIFILSFINQNTADVLRTVCELNQHQRENFLDCYEEKTPSKFIEYIIRMLKCALNESGSLTDLMNEACSQLDDQEFQTYVRNCATTPILMDYLTYMTPKQEAQDKNAIEFCLN